MFWERKGNTTYDLPPAYLLQLSSMYKGLTNHVADALSQDFQLTWADLFPQFLPHLSQKHGYQLWTPPSALISAVISALLRKQCPRESLLVVLSPPSGNGRSGSTSASE